MNLINCKKCGILFQKKLRNLCDRCLEIENISIEKIGRFIESCSENFVSMQLISEKTGIERTEIEDLYKKGRLTAYNGRITTNCKSCGAEIKDITKKGNFCPKCIQQIFGENERKPINDPSKVQVDLRDFDRDIMHSRKIITPEIKFKYGFKKSYE